jgi:hypothetical protein
MMVSKLFESRDDQIMNYIEIMHKVFEVMQKTYQDDQDPIISSTLASFREGKEISIGLCYVSWICFLSSLSELRKTSNLVSFLYLYTTLKFYLFTYFLNLLEQNEKQFESLMENLSSLLLLLHQLFSIMELTKYGFPFIFKLVSEMISYKQFHKVSICLLLVRKKELYIRFLGF